MSTNTIHLTQYSHGAGCGCKISPAVLDEILKSNFAMPDNKHLLVGNHSKDDAAVYELDNETALIATTDFFMPIVDDPFQFGRIAAANAISDVYAMGGKPLLAIAILGWPVNKIPAGVAQKVIEGGRSICLEAGIPLAGGHSIDSPEPIFGLAVNGIVKKSNIKQNNTAQPGDILFLTKPLGIGILTTAEKKGILKPEHREIAANQMMQLNRVGERLGECKGVHAMTDVTGFGLLGHLVEMAEGSNCSAEINLSAVPYIIPELEKYVQLNSVPGGTTRNLDSYRDKIRFEKIADQSIAESILADPQTSGGLLLACAADAQLEIENIFKDYQLEGRMKPVGRILPKSESVVIITK